MGSELSTQFHFDAALEGQIFFWILVPDLADSTDMECQIQGTYIEHYEFLKKAWKSQEQVRPFSQDEVVSRTYCGTSPALPWAAPSVSAK